MSHTTMLDFLVSVEELAPVIFERNKEKLRLIEEWKLSDLSELNLPKDDFERVVFLILSRVPMDQFSDFISSAEFIKPDDIQKLTSDIRKTFASYIKLSNDQVLAILTENERYKIIAKFSPEILITAFLFRDEPVVDHKNFVTALKFIPDDYGLQSVLHRYADVKKQDFYEKDKIVKNTRVILTDYFSKQSTQTIAEKVSDYFKQSRIEFIGDDLLASFIDCQSDQDIHNRYRILKNELTSKWVHKDQVLGLFSEPFDNSEKAVIEDVPFTNPAEESVPSAFELKPVTPVQDNQPSNKREEIPVFTLNSETRKITFEEKQVQPSEYKMEAALTPAETEPADDDDNVPLFLKLQRAAQKREEEEQAAQQQMPAQTRLFDVVPVTDSVSVPTTEEKTDDQPFQLTKPDEAEVTFDPAKKIEPKNPYPPLERLITQNQAKLFVKNLFNRDERRFVMIIKDLNDITSWEEGKKYIELIFTEFKVDLYSREAIQFTDIVYGRYHHL